MKTILLNTFILAFAFNISAQCDDTLPILEDFEDSNVINVCWNLMDQDGDGNNWYWKEYGPSYGGYKCLSSNEWTSGQGYLNPDNWITSYAIDLESIQPSENLEVSWKVRGELVDFSHINYSVYAATGNQISDFESSTYNVTEFVDEIGAAGSFVTRTLDVSELAGSTIYIAFRHKNFSGDQYLINIDDVSVAVTSTLGINEIEQNLFTHYYNSSTEQLSLESGNNTMNALQIYNILGQVVLNKKLDQTEEHINLSTLNKGVYIVKVNFNDIQKTFKFLKH